MTDSARIRELMLANVFLSGGDDDHTLVAEHEAGD
jgi:hypothetical protein